MVTPTQKSASKKNLKRAQPVWQGMSFHKHAMSGSVVSKRAATGITSHDEYYRIIVRPKEQFTIFRTQDIGKPGALQRLAGKCSGGTWATQAWLVNKGSAHVEGKKLVADNKDVQDLIRQLGSQPVLEKDDIFSTKSSSTIIRTNKPAMEETNKESGDDEEESAVDCD
jgi:hypothetical protein